VKWDRNKQGNGVFRGETFKDYVDGVSVSSGLLTSSNPNDPSSSSPRGLDLTSYGGLIVRCCGDGSSFNFVIRTSTTTYTQSFETSAVAKDYGNGKRTSMRWGTVNLGFNRFKDERNGELLKREGLRDVRQVGVEFRSKGGGGQEEGKKSGTFYLSMSYIKVYKAR